MNPLIKKTVEKISGHVKMTEGEKLFVAGEIGDAILKALTYAKENPNFNLKGGNSIDENTIGNVTH
jgi:hypothetical protein